ncbi:NAD(P)H-binding protein [Mycobacterium sp. ITM-2016-00318]|uniref:NAD(P)H-binding protein n=1 Tax=Mycobacterium sp. ITM-2016-00318 TaxID=2099693 RepID=UPI00287F90BC|nr:NAD(P)H-binding protein [Mycobacterium sp. ITM-2016-00318]WNG91800.1 NAD(P)H-binding protein [Mycobacterium sp. ITM-2016-00318]
MNSMRTLVTGATGYVGSRLVTELLSRGHHVVATSRKAERLADFGWSDEVSAVSLDAHDPTSARKAFAEAGPVDVIYYLVHGIGQPDFRDADNAAATNVAVAAKEAGVRRIVYLGGFVPEEGELSEHLTSRAEVAESLSIDGGPEVVWLGAAMIIGAGSTSFEMLRYVGDRFLLIPSPAWMTNPMDPISIHDVLYYLVAAADGDTVPAGAYDIAGPESTTYRDLLAAYGRATGKWRASVPIRGVGTGVVSMVAPVVLPVPGGLAADLVESLDHPMKASDGLRELVADPPGGLVAIDDAINRSLSNGRARPVNELEDPHHLADTDPVWAGGDAHRIKQVARTITPPIARPALGLLNVVPGPVAAALRTGLDSLINLVPKEPPA